MNVQTPGEQPANPSVETVGRLGQRIKYDSDHLRELLYDGQYEEAIPDVIRIHNNLVTLQATLDSLLGESGNGERWRAMNLSQGAPTGKWDYLVVGILIGAFVMYLLVK